MLWAALCRKWSILSVNRNVYVELPLWINVKAPMFSLHEKAHAHSLNVHMRILQQQIGTDSCLSPRMKHACSSLCLCMQRYTPRSLKQFRFGHHRNSHTKLLLFSLQQCPCQRSPSSLLRPPRSSYAISRSASRVLFGSTPLSLQLPTRW